MDEKIEYITIYMKQKVINFLKHIRDVLICCKRSTNEPILKFILINTLMFLKTIVIIQQLIRLTYEERIKNLFKELDKNL